MAVDLMGYTDSGFAVITEEGALKEAATAEIQGVQELLRLISHSQPRNPEPAGEINSVADVTVNNFKKLISLLDRPKAGHARFRKAPSRPPIDQSEEEIQDPKPAPVRSLLNAFLPLSHLATHHPSPSADNNFELQSETQPE